MALHSAWKNTSSSNMKRNEDGGEINKIKTPFENETDIDVVVPIHRSLEVNKKNQLYIVNSLEILYLSPG